MTKLPPGWWVKNSTGSFAGPPPQPDEDQESDFDDVDETTNEPDGLHGLDIRPDSPGWEDMEPDTEAMSLLCLLCPQQFPSPNLMFDHCKAKHNFDFVAIVKQHQLDFYNTIKYINLMRSRVQSSKPEPEQLDLAALASDDLLKPVLENDALLFSLDDFIDFDTVAGQDAVEDMAMDGTG